MSGLFSSLCYIHQHPLLYFSVTILVCYYAICCVIIGSCGLCWPIMGKCAWSDSRSSERVIMWRIRFRQNPGHNNITAPYHCAARFCSSHAFALGMADGERSPLLADLGDGALVGGNGGVSPGSAPYGLPNKPQSEYPWIFSYLAKASVPMICR